MLWLWISLGVLACLLIGYVISVGVTFGVVFGRRFVTKTVFIKPFFGKSFNKHTKTIEKTRHDYENRHYDEVSIMNNDLTLKGRFYENKNSNKIIIFVHGYFSIGTNDIGYLGTLYDDLGVSVLIIDQRACGESEGRYTSLGILERFDVREWIFYLDKQFAGKKDIYLHGVSMGAATALLVSALPGLPKSFKGVIADCGYSRINGVLLHAGNRLFKVRPKFLMWCINLYAKFFGGFNLNKLKVSSELRKNEDIPLLFIHGTEDKFVPFNMSVKNFKSATVKDKKLIAIADAHHCESYLVNSELYFKEVKEFIDEH